MRLFPIIVTAVMFILTVHGCGLTCDEETSVSTAADSLLLHNAYLGQNFLKEDLYDSAVVYLQKAESLLQYSEAVSPEAMSEAACVVYNGLGIYSVNCDMNYENAVTYFLQGARFAESRGEWRKQAVLLSNLVLVYNIRKDPSGLEHASEVYRIGLQHNDEEISNTGAYLCASMYFLEGDTDTAEEYLDIAVRSHGDTDSALVHKLQAEILYSKGQTEEAERYFLRALDNLDNLSASTYTDVVSSYGDFLMAENRYREAVTILKKGMEQAITTGNRVRLFNIYHSLSDAHRKIGEYETALYWYEKFHDESYDVFNIQMERQISTLNLRYEQERHEREVSQYQLQLLTRKRQSQLLLCILIVLIPLTGSIWVMYRNKDMMYIQIARQYKQMADKMSASSPKYARSSLAEDRNDEILRRLTDLMEKDRVYRRTDITVESLSEMLHVNRTYLSQVINGQLGMSFNAYINSYRIQEGVNVLSDPGSDMPLKALAASVGFNSLSLFYKLFREKVGMPPAKFREKMIFLSKENN